MLISNFIWDQRNCVLLYIYGPTVFVCFSIRLSLTMFSYGNNKKDFLPMKKVARKCLEGNTEKQVQSFVLYVNE